MLSWRGLGINENYVVIALLLLLPVIGFQLKLTFESVVDFLTCISVTCVL